MGLTVSSFHQVVRQFRPGLNHVTVAPFYRTASYGQPLLFSGGIVQVFPLVLQVAGQLPQGVLFPV